MTAEYIDEVLIALKVISFIKEGQKVCIRNGMLTLETQSTGVLASIRRWINYDSRSATITYVYNIIKKAIYISNHGSDVEKEKITQALSECISGIDSLMITYNDDAYTHSTLQILKEQIKVNWV